MADDKGHELEGLIDGDNIVKHNKDLGPTKFSEKIEGEAHDAKLKIEGKSHDAKLQTERESHEATLWHKRYVLWCVGGFSVAWFVVIVWTLVYLGLLEQEKELPTPVLIALIAAGTSTAAVMPTILASAVFSKKKTEIPDTLAKLVKLLKEAGLGDKK